MAIDYQEYRGMRSCSREIGKECTGFMFLSEVLLERYLGKNYLDGNLERLDHETHIEVRK